LKISKRLVIFSVLALAFLALASVAQAAPAAQTPVPDPGSISVYGISWALVGSAIVGLLLYFGVINENTAVLITAGWATAGYVLVQNLPALEEIAPWLPVALPQILMAILIFAAQLGIIQVARAGRRAYAAARHK
jgi:hypothetical protein